MSNETKAALSADEVCSWIKTSERLPIYNRKVVAYLVGAEFHSGLSWCRDGFAFMVRHEGSTDVVKDGWSQHFYKKACAELGADSLEVTHWMPLKEPA